MANKKSGNPQLEDGYTSISNELLEEIARTPSFTAVQLQIILLVIRQTYGFKRKSHGLSAKFISRATGRNYRVIAREIDKLIAENVLTEYERPTPANPRKIGINKYYKSWGMYQEVHAPDGTHTSVPCGTEGMYSEVQSGMYQEVHQIKKYNKENIKEKERKDFPSENEEPDAWELLDGEVIS